MSWQPIETAPKDGTYVLLWTTADHGITFVDVALYESGAWRTGDYTVIEVFNVKATHWMPLPEPPRLPVDEEGL